MNPIEFSSIWFLGLTFFLLIQVSEKQSLKALSNYLLPSLFMSFGIYIQGLIGVTLILAADIWILSCHSIENDSEEGVLRKSWKSILSYFIPLTIVVLQQNQIESNVLFFLTSLFILLRCSQWPLRGLVDESAGLNQSEFNFLMLWSTSAILITLPLTPIDGWIFLPAILTVLSVLSKSQTSSLLFIWIILFWKDPSLGLLGPALFLSADLKGLWRSILLVLIVVVSFLFSKVFQSLFFYAGLIAILGAIFLNAPKKEEKSNQFLLSISVALMAFSGPYLYNENFLELLRGHLDIQSLVAIVSSIIIGIFGYFFFKNRDYSGFCGLDYIETSLSFLEKIEAPSEAKEQEPNEVDVSKPAMGEIGQLLLWIFSAIAILMLGKIYL